MSEVNEAGVSTKMEQGMRRFSSHILNILANHWQLPVDPLAVPELLASILSFATSSTLASCAVMCKPWSQVALDKLWKHMDSVFPLLELVLNMELLRDLESLAPNSLEVRAVDPLLRLYSHL